MHRPAHTREVHDGETFAVFFAGFLETADLDFHSDQPDGFGCGDWFAHIFICWI